MELQSQSSMESGSSTPQDTAPSEDLKDQHGNYRNLWGAHLRKILVACGLVVLPMVAFTIAIIWLVFAKRVAKLDCPNPFLCQHALVNSTSKADYYVDYPAARLVFISSWSSTISFSIVSMLMSLFGYSIAKRFLCSSSTQAAEALLPTPYQTSVLIRILNADLLCLWDVACTKAKMIFWNKEQSSNENHRKSPWILRLSIFMFLLCLLASVLVQVADTYLHIVTEATTMVQFETGEPDQFHYSMGLAPWCLDRETIGSQDNKNFWGCGIHYNPDNQYTYLANLTLLNEIDVGDSKDYAMNYTGDDGSQFAIVGPTHIEPNIGWSASSIGVSTQCSPIPWKACDTNVINGAQFYGDYVIQFNCSKERAGVDITGHMIGVMHQIYFFNFHKYLQEPIPFNSYELLGMDMVESIAPNVTDDEIVFNNPWRSLNVVTIETEKENLREDFRNDNRVWKDDGNAYAYMVLLCNTTVWDVTYTAVDRTVTSLTHQISNSTIAGTASMPSVGMLGLFATEYDQALQKAAGSLQSPQDFIDSYAAGIGRVFTLPIATQLTPRPAALVQTQTSKVITKVPVAALWFLVSANLLYALLGLTMAIFALIAADSHVHQVHTRLSITGVVAQLFDKTFSERAVQSESDLFLENAEKGAARPKKVCVRRTDTGGTIFAVSEKGR